MTLARMLAAAAARQPDATAIVDGERRQGYGAWQAEIKALAGGLRAMGLGPSDHLVAVLTNRSETASLYWACQMLGVIFTPFNWRASAAMTRGSRCGRRSPGWAPCNVAFAQPEF